LGKKPAIKVLEMGFGTGLNAIMSAQFAFFHNAYIDYTGIEAFPIAKEDYQNLNYPEMLNLDENLNGIFQGLHLNSTAFSTYFIGQVIHQILEEYTTEEKYDVIYYDAFAPTSQAELWTVEIMQKMYGFLKPEGILVSYCAQGQFKRNLKEAGFMVEALPGPLGKREMTRAIKPSNNQY
jgi:tRNA U34 5-methylaminomethyl-2-thiouridine-forming methyltransferase MnmC